LARYPLFPVMLRELHATLAENGLLNAADYGFDVGLQ
jgi:hypothetical protein